MLIEKSITMNTKKRFTSASKYICDMCKKPLEKKDRTLVATSQKGKDTLYKKWDLCEQCLKVIDKNVNIWYNKRVNKK